MNADCDNLHQNCNLRTKHLANDVWDTAVFGKTGAEFILEQKVICGNASLSWTQPNSLDVKSQLPENCIKF
jgi:hypothetical protein